MTLALVAAIGDKHLDPDGRWRCFVSAENTGDASAGTAELNMDVVAITGLNVHDVQIDQASMLHDAAAQPVEIRADRREWSYLTAPNVTGQYNTHIIAGGTNAPLVVINSSQNVTTWANIVSQMPFKLGSPKVANAHIYILFGTNTAAKLYIAQMTLSWVENN